MSRQAKNKKVNATVVVEKTPSYFVTEEVPARVHAMNSSAKIILVVKDPVTRLLSDYSQLAAKWRRYVLHPLFMYFDRAQVWTLWRRHLSIIACISSVMVHLAFWLAFWFNQNAK